MDNIFETLNALNVNGHTETKKSGGTELTYLSWPWAWAEVKRRFPEARYEIWRDAQGRPYAYDPLTGYMVYTTVTIGGQTHTMWLPVMDGANNAMKAEPYTYTVKNPNYKYAKWDERRNGRYDKFGNRQEETITKRVEAATMFDVNKAIMRCLVKNLAMFGLGLYIYAGEDLPEGGDDPEPPKGTQEPPKGTQEAAQEAGRRKLEEVNRELAGMDQQPSTARRMATEEQKEFIRKNADDVLYMQAMQHFGPDLERLTIKKATKLISRIQGEPESA